MFRSSLFLLLCAAILRVRAATLPTIEFYRGDKNIPIYPVVPLENTPTPPPSGTQGFLYDFGFACNKTDVDRILSTVKSDFIALVDQSLSDTSASPNAQCDTPTKFQNIRDNRLKGVILILPVDTESPPQAVKDIPFPVYRIRKTIATTLQNEANQTSDARVSLMPAQRTPNIWQFVLIVVVILLGVSFVTSIALHFWLYRRRRLAQQGFGGAQDTPFQMRGHTLDKDVIESFPTKVYNAAEAKALKEERRRSRKILHHNSHSTLNRSPSHSIAGAADVDTSFEAETNDISTPVSRPQDVGDTSGSPPDFSEKDIASVMLRRNASMKSTRTFASVRTVEGGVSSETCAICLDEYADGVTLRELPCGHIFHTTCIDPWLMEQSSTCPMCKEDTTPEHVRIEIEKAGIGFGFDVQDLILEPPHPGESSNIESGPQQQTSEPGASDASSAAAPRGEVVPPWHVRNVRVSRAAPIFVAPTLVQRFSQVTNSPTTPTSPIFPVASPSRARPEEIPTMPATPVTPGGRLEEQESSGP